GAVDRLRRRDRRQPDHADVHAQDLVRTLLGREHAGGRGRGRAHQPSGHFPGRDRGQRAAAGPGRAHRPRPGADHSHALSRRRRTGAAGAERPGGRRAARPHGIPRGGELPVKYLRQLWWIIWFQPYLLWQIARSNMTVGADALTPGSRMSAGFIEVPLRCRSDFEIMMMANMITLTPGTVTVAVDQRSSTLWIHNLYLTSPEEARQDVYA